VSPRGAAVALAIAAATGCKDPASRRAPVQAFDAARAAAPDRAAVPPEVAALPGAIWFAAGPDPHGPPTVLVRLAGGVRTAVADDGEGRRLWASRWLLPDGALVAIASRADGGPDGERLVRVAADGTVAPIGAPALQVREPAVDPGGRWIVAAAMVDRISELYRYDLPAGTATPLTDNKEGNFHPAVLGPDAIVFVSSRDGDSELYRCDAAGKRVQRLTAFHKDDWEPVVSPDGKTIAFLSDREGSARIFVMAPDGTGQRRLTDRAAGDVIDEADPVWSPDGARLAYRAGARVWLRDVAAGTERAVTPDGATDAFPSFSPDGTYLAVERDGAVWALPVVDGGAAIRVAAGRMPRWVAR
jgi:dipeptidyl aminopeptidase/acylaminoacyl peptidase